VNASAEDLDERQAAALWAELYRFVRASGCRRQDSEDLVQETFLRVGRRTIAFENAAHRRGYYFSAARNLAINALRRGGRIVYNGELIEGSFSPAPDPAEQAQATELETHLRERLREVGAAVAAFMNPDCEPPAYRTAASRSGLREGALRTAVSRCRKRLRSDLAELLAA